MSPVFPSLFVYIDRYINIYIFTRNQRKLMVMCFFLHNTARKRMEKWVWVCVCRRISHSPHKIRVSTIQVCFWRTDIFIYIYFKTHERQITYSTHDRQAICRDVPHHTQSAVLCHQTVWGHFVIFPHQHLKHRVKSVSCCSRTAFLLDIKCDFMECLCTKLNDEYQ